MATGGMRTRATSSPTVELQRGGRFVVFQTGIPVPMSPVRRCTSCRREPRQRRCARCRLLGWWVSLGARITIGMLRRHRFRRQADPAGTRAPADGVASRRAQRATRCWFRCACSERYLCAAPSALSSPGRSGGEVQVQATAWPACCWHRDQAADVESGRRRRSAQAHSTVAFAGCTAPLAKSFLKSPPCPGRRLQRITTEQRWSLAQLVAAIGPVIGREAVLLDVPGASGSSARCRWRWRPRRSTRIGRPPAGVEGGHQAAVGHLMTRIGVRYLEFVVGAAVRAWPWSHRAARSSSCQCA